MQTETSCLSGSDCRADARRLLKSLRSSHVVEAMKAALRMRRLRPYSSLPVSQILARCAQIQLKHALTVVALENGFESWVALKVAGEQEAGGLSGGGRPGDGGVLMYEPGFDVLLNRWFSRYDQARASLDENGGFLLPYRRQFLICEAEAIRLLGLDPEDSDWQRIGYDWVEPSDREAWSRLKEHRQRAKRCALGV